jgi:hypothetical protein
MYVKLLNLGHHVNNAKVHYTFLRWFPTREKAPLQMVFFLNFKNLNLFILIFMLIVQFTGLCRIPGGFCRPQASL